MIQGPDAGKRIFLAGADVRIGRGAGNQIRMDDPAWQDGYVQVKRRQSSYVVANHMPHTVYIDGDVLEPKSQRTWYAGALLQPTSVTVLRLDMVEAPQIPLGEDGVRVETINPPKGMSKKSEYLLLFVLVLASLILVLRSGAAPSARNGVVQSFEQLEPQFAELERERPIAYRVQELKKTLGYGVFWESGSKRAIAYQKYLEAREQIDAIARVYPNGNIPDPYKTECWLIVRQFVNDRMIATAARP